LFTTGHISSTACILLVFAAGIINGCAAVAVSAASEAVSGKTVTEHVVSAASGKNCDVLEGVARQDRNVCEEPNAPATKRDFDGLADTDQAPGKR
jgi:hypothetical protein